VARLRWPGVEAPALRRLSDLAPAEWARAAHAAAADGGPLLGIAEAGLTAIPLHLAGSALLVYGDPGTGRTALLARLLRDASVLSDETRPHVYVLDYLGSLVDRCGDDSCLTAAAFGPHEAPDVLAALVDELTRRQRALAAARRQAEATTAGPPVWLLVDDYELVHVAARPGLVGDLANLVPYASRLGFGLVLNQGAGGSSTRVDPLVRRVLESAPWHLQFGVESKLELLLKGTRGMPLPPGQAVLTRPGRPEALLGVLPPVALPGTSRRPRIRLVS
jgi:hypothetical protein